MFSFFSSRAIKTLNCGLVASGAPACASFISFRAVSKSPLADANAREFAMRVPLVRTLLNVHLENGKPFVLLVLNLQAAAINMQLESIRDFESFFLGRFGFLLFPPSRPRFLICSSYFQNGPRSEWTYLPIERLLELIIVVEAPSLRLRRSTPRKKPPVLA